MGWRSWDSSCPVSWLRLHTPSRTAKGEIEESAALFERSVEECRISRNPAILSQATYHLGRMRRKQGQPGKALECLLEAARLCIDQDDTAGLQTAVTEFVSVASETGHLDVAVCLLGAAEALPGHVGIQPLLSQHMHYIRPRMDEAAFATAWEAGRSMSRSEIIAKVESLTSSLHEELTTPVTGPRAAHGLTPREMEVLGLIAEGRTNRSIAETLSLSERTVENHVLHILTKLRIESRSAAAAYAVRNGLA